jgi:hypothetical protein
VSTVPDYNGCGQWGGFEDDQIAFLERHDRSGQARWVPRLSNVAQDGRQSAIVPAGTTLLPPILWTAAIPHRLTCYLKADKPVDVTLQVGPARQVCNVGTDWTKVVLDVTPSSDLWGEVPGSLSAPAGATILLDTMSFHPAPAGKP